MHRNTLIFCLLSILFFTSSCISPGYSYSLITRPNKVQPLENIYYAIYFDKELSSQQRSFKDSSSKKYDRLGIRFSSKNYDFTQSPEVTDRSLLLEDAKEQNNDFLLILKQKNSDVREGWVPSGNPMGGATKVSLEYYKLEAFLIHVSDSSSIWTCNITLDFSQNQPTFGSSTKTGKFIANQLISQLKEDGFIR